MTGLYFEIDTLILLSIDGGAGATMTQPWPHPTHSLTGSPLLSSTGLCIITSQSHGSMAVPCLDYRLSGSTSVM